MALILEVLVLWFRLVCCYAEAFFRKIVPPTPKDVNGKLVLITGAGKGIGRALALEFAKHGARLALWDIDQKGNEETVYAVKTEGCEARAYVCDITKRDHVRETANQVRADMGEVDILVNNAGIMICKNFMDVSEDEIRRTFEINTIAHFWTVKEFLPAMMKKNSGHIVNMASMSGRHGCALQTDYCSSKFGVIGFTEALQAELYRMKQEGVKLSVVCPMGVNTRLMTGVADRVEFRDRLGTIMEPEEVAQMVVDGMRRDAFKIFCPDRMKNTVLMAELVPAKAARLLEDFMEAGYFPTKGGKAE